jgi:hypothetical protein
MICWRATSSVTPLFCWKSFIDFCTPDVSMKPGEIMLTRTPFDATPFARPLL